MPGILPMKVIKVGNSSQSRIAQACDRCRSKKIRCDGIRPCCSQCANVGFECRTSDKLSRRAFPRGYTESLEERVRQLESEVRELKDLLDEKDEKIDMLSKMHGNSRRMGAASPSSMSSASVDSRRDSAQASVAKEDSFRVQASPLLLGVENSDSYFMGASSGRTFIESFKKKIQEGGKTSADFNPETFLHLQGCSPLAPGAADEAHRIPPRLFTDRCVNVYFQEWAPLFPVLHKPTFLRTYEEFVADPEKVRNSHKLAQVYLVFSIAGISGENADSPQVAFCEQQWQRALDTIMMENTIQTLQCLVLALMYTSIRADYKRLQHYKGVAVGLSHRLGLHQSQKRFSFGALTIETRKKVFWTLYTLDCFSAAVLGLPKLLKEEDVHAEYPSDTDDEYVTEKGFQPTLPGEFTRLSSALALFRVSRILAQVLEKIYPATTSYDLSLQQMSSLESELSDWWENLPVHLKLNFAQDKPSTDVTGSRSPILALAYYSIRTLIYRPAVGSSLGSKAAPAVLAVGDSSKHIIQIIQLLDERSMTFSFCLNRSDTLVLCGMAILYQMVDLKQDSKLLRDGERLVNAVAQMFACTRSPGPIEFQRIARSLVPAVEAYLPTPPRPSPEASMPAPPQRTPSSDLSIQKKGLVSSLGRLAVASCSETDLLQQQEKLRRMTLPNSEHNKPELYRSRSRPSLDGGMRPEVSLVRREQRMSMSQASTCTSHSAGSHPQPNLDYLSLGNTPSHSQPSSPVQARAISHPQQQLPDTTGPLSQHQLFAAAQLPQKLSSVSTADWEAILGAMDGGMNNVYDAIYGGPALSISETPGSATTATATATATACGNGWSPEPWELGSFNLGDMSSSAGPTASVLSLSEESLSSSEDMAAASEMGIGVYSHRGSRDSYVLDGMPEGMSGGFSV